MIEASDTRLRIIEVATELFADRGLKGASIREIAKLAQVNLAAVNYHFKTKENLYLEVVSSGIEHFVADMQKISVNCHSTEEYAISIFQGLVAHGNKLVNNFRVMLSDFEFTEHMIKPTELPGPPGIEFLLAKIDKEVSSNCDPEKKQWVAKVIFTYVVHMALITSSNFGKHRCSKLFIPGQIEKEIKLLTKTLLTGL